MPKSWIWWTQFYLNWSWSSSHFKILFWKKHKMTTNQVPEIWFLGTKELAKKNGSNASWTWLSFNFCHVFWHIFDNFPKELLNFEKSLKLWQKSRKASNFGYVPVHPSLKNDDTLQKLEACAQRNVPEKRFKICYILCVRKPM